MSTSLWIVSIVLVVLGLLTAIQSLVVLELLRQVAQIRTRLSLDDHPTPLPTKLLGKRVSSPAKIHPSFAELHQPIVLLFLSDDCTTCHLVADAVPELVGHYGNEMAIAGVVHSNGHNGYDKLQELGTLVVVDGQDSVARSLDVHVRPAAVALHDGHMMRAVSVRNGNQLREFLEEVKDATVGNGGLQVTNPDEPSEVEGRSAA